MRRTASSRHSLFNYQDPTSSEMLAASFEDALKSGLSDDWRVDSVSSSRKHSNPWNTLKCIITDLTNGSEFKRDYSFGDYHSIENAALALSVDIAMFKINQLHPNLKITGADTRKKSIYVQRNHRGFPDSLEILSACYKAETGEFFPHIYAKLANIEIDLTNLPEVIKCPIVLNAEQIELGCVEKNIFYSDLQPGYGNAVYITGEGQLGKWETATRLNRIQGRWRYTPPLGITCVEAKFLTGPFVVGEKTVKVDRLEYEKIEGNRQIELTLFSP